MERSILCCLLECQIEKCASLLAYWLLLALACQADDVVDLGNCSLASEGLPLKSNGPVSQLDLERKKAAIAMALQVG